MRSQTVTSRRGTRIRIDVGEGGFADRTVSLTDIAWVLAARERAAGTGEGARRWAGEPAAVPGGDAEGVD